jgi:hypothetical protein
LRQSCGDQLSRGRALGLVYSWLDLTGPLGTFGASVRRMAGKALKPTSSHHPRTSGPQTSVFNQGLDGDQRAACRQGIKPRGSDLYSTTALIWSSKLTIDKKVLRSDLWGSCLHLRLWKVLPISGFLAGCLALDAQDMKQPGAVPALSQGPAPGTPVNRVVVPKLDTKGKAVYWWRHGFGVGILTADVVAASINQVDGTPPEWKGTAGYGKRLGDTIGSSSIAAGIGFGISAALHIDPRYYRCTRCGVWGHIGSATKQSFVYRTDGGRPVPAIPELAGIYGAGMISMYWYPSRYQPLSDGIRRANYVMLWRLGFNLVREFAPEKARKFFRLTPNDIYDDQ